MFHNHIEQLVNSIATFHAIKLLYKSHITQADGTRQNIHLQLRISWRGALLKRSTWRSQH